MLIRERVSGSECRIHTCRALQKEQDVSATPATAQQVPPAERLHQFGVRRRRRPSFETAALQEVREGILAAAADVGVNAQVVAVVEQWVRVARFPRGPYST